ncbi:outer membrane beta-barrel protein [Flavobacterium covae]|nr:outer membrane beta-barrel protein [Flavobacterium covae]QYS91717.1 outer membrane beta-barrel protein [Flavobacterium covae]
MITAFRAEYYNDKNQIIVPTGTPNGFQVLGFSSNLDYELSEKLKFRFEAKAFNAKDRIFNNDNNNYSVTTSLIFRT